MTSTLVFLLVSHVIIGLVGVMASYAVFTGLLKRKISLWFLKVSAWIAYLAYIFSWLMGGIYYIAYYGGSVKPIIKAGEYPWAHTVIMESKEHIFLFLPFLSFVILLILLLKGETLKTDVTLKRALTFVAGISALLGIIIALGGVLISGAAR